MSSGGGDRHCDPGFVIGQKVSLLRPLTHTVAQSGAVLEIVHTAKASDLRPLRPYGQGEMPARHTVLNGSKNTSDSNKRRDRYRCLDRSEGVPRYVTLSEIASQPRQVIVRKFDMPLPSRPLQGSRERCQRWNPIGPGRAMPAHNPSRIVQLSSRVSEGGEDGGQAVSLLQGALSAASKGLRTSGKSVLLLADTNGDARLVNSIQVFNERATSPPGDGAVKSPETHYPFKSVPKSNFILQGPNVLVASEAAGAVAARRSSSDRSRAEALAAQTLHLEILPQSGARSPPRPEPPAAARPLKKVLLSAGEDGSLKLARPDGQAACEATQIAVQQRLHRDMERMKQRHEIAEQFRRDWNLQREQPPRPRALSLPARTVHVADRHTQTELFALLEPGRMVEMTVTGVAGGQPRDKPTSAGRSGSGEHPSADGGPAAAPALDPGPAEAKRRRLSGAAAMGGRSVQSHHSLRGGPLGTTPMVQIHSPPSPSPAANINQALPNNINMPALGCSKQLIRKAIEDFRNSDIPDRTGNMPIHNAVLDGNLMQVRRQCIIFRARRETVDIYNSDKKTALHLAVLDENEKIIEELLRYGANPGAPDQRGNTALHLAVDHTESDVALRAVLRHTDRFSSVLDQANDEGYSPLHLCAMQNRKAHAVLLLECGAEVNLCDKKSGRTALFHAVESNLQQLSSQLLQYGASTTTQNFAGHMPLNACESSIALMPDIIMGALGGSDSGDGGSRSDKTSRALHSDGDVEMEDASDLTNSSLLNKICAKWQFSR